jgi:hypothetical protein
MHRVTPHVLALIMLIAGISHAQSLADAARTNRKQKAREGATATKVISDDDLAAPTDVTVHLVPGATSTGDGTLLAPGMWKHSYSVTNLDVTRFSQRWGSPHRDQIRGRPAEASFDLYSQGARLPSGGFPNPLANAHDVPSGSTARIDYRFDHGTVLQFCAEGSWHAKAGDRNNYNFTVNVGSR